MKNDILDSNAWIECLDDGPNTERFLPVLKKLPELLVPSITITEVRKVVLRQRTASQEDVVTRTMCSGHVVALDEAIAIDAAELSIQHKLPLADSLIYATDLHHEATLWTQEDRFKGLPRVKYFPKTKSNLRR